MNKYHFLALFFSGFFFYLGVYTSDTTNPVHCSDCIVFEDWPDSVSKRVDVFDLLGNDLSLSIENDYDLSGYRITGYGKILYREEAMQPLHLINGDGYNDFSFVYELNYPPSPDSVYFFDEKTRRLSSVSIDDL